MKTTNSLLCIAVIVAAIAACGGGSSSPSDTLEDMITTFCERAHACRDSYIPAMNGDRLFEDVYSSRVDNCVTDRTSLFFTFVGADYFDKFDASVDAGKIKYNSDNADACLDAIRGQNCDALFGQNGERFKQPPACDLVFVGTVPTGGSCTIEDDCATDGDDCLPTNVCG